MLYFGFARRHRRCFSQVCGFHALEEWLGLGQLEDYLSVLEYLLWVFTPLAIVFILPFLIVILLYLSILFLHVYKVRKNNVPFLTDSTPNSDLNPLPHCLNEILSRCLNKAMEIEKMSHPYPSNE